MRYRIGLLIVLMALALVPRPATAADGGRDLQDILRPVMDEYALPALVAAVAGGGEILASGAVGVRAVGFPTEPGVDDPIHIGSDGKAMTATLAATLVEEGLLGWDSTVGEILGDAVPDMNPALAGVRLEQLLSHSGGIPSDTPEMMDIYFNVNAFDHNPSTLRLMALDAWKHNAPSVPAGSPFQYSNFGYLIAGAMIETAAGKPWEQLMHERLFAPLGLTTAGLGPTATAGKVDALVGHQRLEDGTALPRLWGAGADMPLLLGPAGTVHMSILDFARWGAWNAGGGRRGPALVEPDTLAHLFAEKVRTPRRPNPPPGTPAEGGYALGWSIEKFDWSDRELLTHNGSNGMNLAKILVDLERDLTIVVATNIGGREADLAAGKVLATLYGMFQ